MIDASVDKGGEGESTSLSLLARVLANDEAAWPRFVGLYSRLIYRWCLRFGLRDEEAADVGQDVFLAVARSIQTFHRNEAGDSFRGWLYTITRNKIRDWANTRRERGQGRSNSDRLDSIPAELDESSVWDDRRLLVHQAIELVRGEFEPRTWEAFWRVAVDGLPADAVAAELGMTRAAVYIAKGRVRRRLIDEFGDLVEFTPAGRTDAVEE